MAASSWRAGGRALAFGAGAASVAASGAPVQARALAPAPPVQAAYSSLKDDDDTWLLADRDPNSGEVVLFRPFSDGEVDAAIEHVQGLVFGRAPEPPRVVIDEDMAGGSSTPDSDGSDGMATAVITDTALLPTDARGAGAPAGMDTLLQLTNRLMKRPGVQVEIAKAMMEDKEIQEVLLRESDDLDNYLLAMGAGPVSLLPPAAQVVDTHSEGGEGAPLDLVKHVVGAIAGAFEGAGTAMDHVARWLRAKLAGRPSLAAPGDDDCDADGEQRDDGDDGRAGRILRGVLTVGVAVVLMIVLRRPTLSFLRRARV